MADELNSKKLSLDGHGLSHHTEDITADREPYGPPGLQGLVTNPFVLMCAACSTLGGLLFGYDQGVVSVILVMDQFLEEFPRVSGSGAGFWKGLLTAMIELGALIGALNQGWIADLISRRYSILVAVAIFTVGSVLQTAAVGYAMLTVARFIGGLGIGMLSMVAPLYISEISPPESRGTLLVLEEWCIVLGIVIAYWITYGTRYMAGEWAWRLPFLLQMIPGFVLAAGVMILPFSPRWLASKNRNEEALQSLCRLRNLPASDRRIRQEMLEIQVDVRFHQELNAEKHPNLQGGGSKNSILRELVSWVDCFRKGCWRRTHIGIMMSFFQQFVGINALIYYSPSLFGTMGLDTDMQLIMSGVLNVLQLVGVSTSVFTMDTVGRRKLLMIGSALMAMSHIIIAILVGLYSSEWSTHKVEGWVSAAFLLFYMIAFGASWGPIPWAMPSEIFPSSLRAKGVALSTCSNWLNNFIIGLITPPLVEDTGYGAYVFFAVFCVLSGIWTYFFVPETMGRSLESISMIFKDNSGGQEMERRRAIEADLISAEFI
ncbi:Major facilitator superfamily domain general substrate transporter [Penicillium taxi]|uniref:Major facilitator superfamily domain general substrate transporter n=1 Tax=Penicillium taxi TaxID=168475 RepID=UPI002545AC05|nr:Major facilitator superfamily domain general substrate transporter [Penicillium taxi]KAJ5908873.1 Major facilitator superfamily domain general substrate transporter [Penicillium taxi]